MISEARVEDSECIDVQGRGDDGLRHISHAECSLSCGAKGAQHCSAGNLFPDI